MYRYEYEALNTGGSFWSDNVDKSHRAIIARRAAEGWRFVGYVPSRFTSNGGIKEIDLVFEKEETA